MSQMQISEQDMNRVLNPPNKIENTDMDEWKNSKENNRTPPAQGKKLPRRNGRFMGEASE
jgi:hypothetical protein